MSREAEIAKIDEELEKLGVTDEGDDTDENLVEEEVEEEEVEETEKAPVEEPKEEAKEPEKKPELKLEIGAELPAATLGYKLREESRKREALERELAEIKKPKIAKEENYEGFIESQISATQQELADIKAWKAEKEQKEREDTEREGAFRELRTYEAEAEAAYDDFPQAANYTKQMIAASIKVLNPSISNEDLAAQTVNTYARHAGLALQNKKHPGEAIYKMAAEMGYKKAEPANERPQIEAKQDNRPKLSVIAENKKKTTGMSGTGGNGKAFITTDGLLSMTNAERMKLTESDWARLEAEG